MRTTSNQGFTLIELMIVIAIIAIIAAIAIPGLLSSQRASNERNASASLKTLASAEADFRGNDRDGNKIQDFWTLDVSGLYGVVPADSTEMIKLIDISVAGADYWHGAGTAGGAVGTTTGLNYVGQLQYAVAAPKAGYWYRAMFTDGSNATTPEDYAVATSGVQNAASAATPFASPWFNHSKFGFLAFPDSFSAGRSVFFVNEGNTIFKRATNGTVNPTAPAPSGTPLVVSATAITGTWANADYWPTDTALKSDYGKLD
jgi:prepilin-type N-terminal cleavage/methylation domain-containing protein